MQMRRSIQALVTIGFLPFGALAASADPAALALVKQQLTNALLVPTVVPAFNPVALLQASFSSGVAQVGAALSNTITNTKPTVQVSGAFNSTSKYTIMMIDGNYAGSSNPKGYNLHWLSNNNQIGSDGSVTNTTAATIPYAGPLPASGSGPHRYTVLLYEQPASFKAPTTPAANSGVNPISLTDYTNGAGFTSPAAATYFTVEIGTATVSVSPTSAVNTASLNHSTGSSTASAPTGSSSSSPSSNGALALSTNVLTASAVALFGVLASALL